MERPSLAHKPFKLGGLNVDPQSRIISGPDRETHIEPKVMAVLLMLASRQGEVVTRQEFIESIWPREYGGEEGLTRAVSRLRKVLATAPSAAIQIETVPKTGYRLVTAD